MGRWSLKANVVVRHLRATFFTERIYTKHIYTVRNEELPHNIDALFCLLRLSSLLSFIWAL